MSGLVVALLGVVTGTAGSLLGLGMAVLFFAPFVVAWLRDLP